VVGQATLLSLAAAFVVPISHISPETAIQPREIEEMNSSQMIFKDGSCKSIPSKLKPIQLLQNASLVGFYE
jgi:hypothetical protein